MKPAGLPHFRCDNLKCSHRDRGDRRTFKRSWRNKDRKETMNEIHQHIIEKGIQQK